MYQILAKFVCSLLLSGVFLSGVHAAPVLIDFEDSSGGGGPGSTMLTTKGMVFDWSVLSPSLPVVTTTGAAGGSGNELLFCGWCEDTNGTSLYASDGSLFGLTSFRFGSLSGTTPSPYNGTVTGYLNGGGTVTQNFSVALGTSDLISFDGSWAGLVSVDIVAATLADGHQGFEAFAIDNVTVNVVPVPAAVWLFASGLGLLGWLRRRQTALT
jgi:hypothetical protein